MPEDDDLSPEEQFREMLQRLLAGQLDPEQLEQLAAMGVDPSQLAQAMTQMQSAFASGDGGIDWEQAKRQALHIANQSDLGVAAAARADLDQAFALATLWLSEATTISELSEPPRAITRGAWVEATLPVWQDLAEPVATSVADALTTTLAEEVPEDMKEMIAGAGRMLRGVGGSLFAAQLGQVVGRLSTEVVSGGDVGIPLMPAGQAVILPQNFADFGQGLEIPEDQLALSVAARELAHARLFRHARWLQLDVTTQIGEYARGIHVDTSALEEIADRFDPSQPEELKQLLASGALLPSPTPQQTAALARLETVLALIEGWVDVVAADATSRLPSADRVAEVVRRRRAVGGPAEKALAS
ncbi:MAG: zinc-dependent metalloprotease, partial [Microbacterium sp.]|uniref:zinc-dependent metalloprotease n=1 Tax=Microbacterium sp. TaxID=51671 RepID=UPI0039E347DD